MEGARVSRISFRIASKRAAPSAASFRDFPLSYSFATYEEIMSCDAITRMDSISERWKTHPKSRAIERAMRRASTTLRGSMESITAELKALRSSLRFCHWWVLVFIGAVRCAVGIKFKLSGRFIVLRQVWQTEKKEKKEKDLRGEFLRGNGRGSLVHGVG